MKCDICHHNIEELFLGKIKGTYLGKKAICSQCQKQGIEALKKKL